MLRRRISGSGAVFERLSTASGRARIRSIETHVSEKQTQQISVLKYNSIRLLCDRKNFAEARKCLPSRGVRTSHQKKHTNTQESNRSGKSRFPKNSHCQLFSDSASQVYWLCIVNSRSGSSRQPPTLRNPF